jgi:phage-related protein
LVIATHGIIKKTLKTPEKEIEKAENIRLRYFDIKSRRNEK